MAQTIMITDRNSIEKWCLYWWSMWLKNLHS